MYIHVLSPRTLFIHITLFVQLFLHVNTIYYKFKTVSVFKNGFLPVKLALINAYNSLYKISFSSSYSEILYFGTSFLTLIDSSCLKYYLKESIGSVEVQYKQCIKIYKQTGFVSRYSDVIARRATDFDSLRCNR